MAASVAQRAAVHHRGANRAVTTGPRRRRRDDGCRGRRAAPAGGRLRLRRGRGRAAPRAGRRPTPSSRDARRAARPASRSSTCSAGRRSTACGWPWTPASSCRAGARRCWSTRAVDVLVRRGSRVVVDVCCGCGGVGTAVASACEDVELHADRPGRCRGRMRTAQRRDGGRGRVPGRPLRPAPRRPARSGRRRRGERPVRADATRSRRCRRRRATTNRAWPWTAGSTGSTSSAGWWRLRRAGCVRTAGCSSRPAEPR